MVVRGNSQGLNQIDWQRPWLQGWREPGQTVAFDVAQGLSVHEALNRAALAPVLFCPAADVPPGVAYEAFVAEQRRVPTRDGAHDFFNGLCWMRFAMAKARLNALQAEAIRQQGVGAARGALRDAITLFDENGAVLLAPLELRQALQRRDWMPMFGELRPLWSQAQLVIFGHALLEKLMAPRKALTAHVLLLPQSPGLEDGALDAALAQALQTEHLCTKPFLPLPVLGVPGWWPANEDADFYADGSVFRPAAPHSASEPNARKMAGSIWATP